MLKKLQKTDIIFALAVLCGLAIHIYFSFLVPFGDDETCYVTIPFRLINGDSLLQHEWNLTQFASLFTYLPTYIWLAIKGSVDGILFFLRYVYIFIHTITTIFLYKFFRKYKIWAVITSIMWYTHVPYRIQAISYHSIFIISLVFLSLCLISIYQQKSSRFYILAGICYGCCCVCNPLFCLVYIFYVFFCIFKIQQKKIKCDNKQKKSVTDENNYNCFFTKDAIKLFSLGVLIVAVIAMLFFLLTGGNIRYLPNNIENLIKSSEYEIVSSSLFFKLAETLEKFIVGSLGSSLMLPILIIALIFDKKKKTNKHRLIYLSILLLWSIICVGGFTFGFGLSSVFHYSAVSMPFFVFSTICYCLTEKKNKTLFYCMYLPCIIGTVFQYLAANTFLYAIGTALTTCNVAGVFFVMDLFKEIKTDFKTVYEGNHREKSAKHYYKFSRNVIIISICLQMTFNGIYYHYQQPLNDGSLKSPKTGLFTGLYMTDIQYNEYNDYIDDMDYIKSISFEDEPVLIISNFNWLYLYLDRPIATYSTWMIIPYNFDLLKTYYKSSTKKRPAYIYIDNGFSPKYYIEEFGEMFEFTSEELSNGVLLNVLGYKY